LCLLAFLVSPLSAQTDTTTAPEPQRRGQRPLRAAIDVNWTFGHTAPEFFEDYRALLGGKASGFAAPIGGSVSVSSFQLGNGAIGVTAGFQRASVRETYRYDPNFYQQPTGPQQTVTQDVEMMVIPAMATLDYFPVNRQFTGYVGCGLGLAAVNFSWTEYLSPSTEAGARPSGVRYDDGNLTPAAMARAGISLAFDDPVGAKTFAGIYFEVAYTYIPFSAPVFTETAETLIWTTPRTSGDYNFQAGGFVVKLGFEVILTDSDKRL